MSCSRSFCGVVLAKHRKKERKPSGKRRSSNEVGPSQPIRGDRQIKRVGFRRPEPRDPHAASENIPERTVSTLRKARELTDKTLKVWLNEAERIRNLPRS